MKVALPLAKNVLAPLGLTASMSAIDGSMQKKIHGSGATKGAGVKLIIEQEDMCSVESCVNKTIIWLYVWVSESLFNVSIVSRLIYTNCVIDSICMLFALIFHRFNQDFRESIHVEVVRVLCAIFKIQWFLSLVFKVLVYAALRRFFSLTVYALETIVSIYLLYFLSLFESSIFVFLV